MGSAADLGLDVDVKPTYRVQRNWSGLQIRYVAQAGQYKVIPNWNVSAKVLHRLGIGADNEGNTFPMYNEFNKIIGIQRRFFNGRKCCVEGSRLGLFLAGLPKVPKQLRSATVGDAGGLKTDSTIFITEGVSDLAVLLDLGFYGIGRPSCNTGEELIVKWLSVNKVAKDTPIVIIADNDPPGIAGANKLRSRLYSDNRRTNVTVVPRGKDLRAYRDAVGKNECRQWLESLF